MDIVFWIILIVLIVGVVWWLLNRSKSSSVGDSAPVRTDGGLAGGSSAASAEAAGTAGIPGAAGFGAPEPAPPTTADEAPEMSSTVEPLEAGAGNETDSTSPGTASRPEEATAPAEPPTAEPLAREEAAKEEPGGSAEPVNRQTPNDEWETQWSEATASPHATASHRSAGGAPAATPATPPAETPPAQDTEYVHHTEFTDPHSPTLPGAETSAAEASGTETEVTDPVRDATPPESAPAAEPVPAAQSATSAEPLASADYQEAPEPTGHLAADQPYGAGSASPGPDGGGPADFDVKGAAGTMVYYEEGHPDYGQTKADVWFESAAHAEAAGFRAPRRTRL